MSSISLVVLKIYVPLSIFKYVIQVINKVAVIELNFILI